MSARYRAVTTTPLLVAALLTAPATGHPVCPPGQVEQTVIWPGGHQALRCAQLPPDPSDDR